MPFRPHVPLLSLALLIGACSGRGELTDGGVAVRDGGGERDAGPQDAGPPDVGATRTASVSIITWNIETFPMTSQTPAAVETIIRDERPDLIAVQEIDDAWEFDRMADRLIGYDGIAADDPRAWIRVGFIYRTDRVVIRGVETMFGNDSYRFPRPPLKVHATFTTTAGETLFDATVVNVHLKAQGDSESEARRRAACITLDDWVTGQLVTDEPDVIILGDYNDRLTDTPRDNVFLPFLQNPETYLFLNGGLVDAGEFSYIPFPGFIDHILITTNALPEFGEGRTEVMPLELTFPDYEFVVSDHRPVRSIFRVEY